MSIEVSFYKYAAIVKNLRGVLYWKGENDKLKWLLSRFKYRYLGLPPSSTPIKGKNIVNLTYPTHEVKTATKLLSKCMPTEAAEALCLASLYISPIMTNSLQDFDASIVKTVKTSKEMDNKDWKLHMRIADYTTLDFYTWATENAAEVLHRSLDEILRERRERIEKDVKRYWRLSEEKGRIFLAYLDPLKAVHQCKLQKELKEVLRKYPDVSSAFGIIATLVL